MNREDSLKSAPPAHLARRAHLWRPRRWWQGAREQLESLMVAQRSPLDVMALASSVKAAGDGGAVWLPTGKRIFA
ncbi:unnamed protein product [Urochloa humidicola]